MTHKFRFLLWLILCAALLFSFVHEESNAKTKGTELSTNAQKVVDYMLEDWNQKFRSTNIAMAIDNVGLEQNDDLRLEIGEYLRGSTEIHNNLKWWGANNYILNNDEKIIAKYLSNTQDSEKRLPDLQETSKAAGLTETELKARLAFMAKAGLLGVSDETKLGYTLVENHNRWGGPFRYNFHTVAIAGEKAFDVW